MDDAVERERELLPIALEAFGICAYFAQFAIAVLQQRPRLEELRRLTSFYLAALARRAIIAFG